MFDAEKNANTDDVSNSAIRVIFNGVNLAQTDLEPLGILFRDEAAHQVTITYAQQVLKVLVDGVEVSNVSGIDLNGTGLSNGYLGFEGKTGAAYANEDILSWSFQSVPEPATVLLLGIGGLVLRRRRVN
jgi:hypothetical protein